MSRINHKNFSKYNWIKVVISPIKLKKVTNKKETAEVKVEVKTDQLLQHIFINIKGAQLQ